MLSEFARKHHIQVVGGSVAERIEDRIYNSMYVFNRSGEQIAKYSKMHLFRLMDEEKFLQAGVTVTFELEQLKAGASICYDIRFPSCLAPSHSAALKCCLCQQSGRIRGASLENSRSWPERSRTKCTSLRVIE